jgi:hypothetical protein
MPTGTPIQIRFTGGMNNVNTPLDLFLKEAGETQDLINADLTYPGKLKLLRPLAAISTTVSAEIHSVYEAGDWVFIGADTVIYYAPKGGGTPVSLITGLSGDDVCFEKAGNWIYYTDGTNKGVIYIGGVTPVKSQLGEDVPDTAPTVAAGTAGNPDGDYSCYYRHKITLADGVTILRTDLSPVAAISVTSDKIEWSDIVPSAFVGATTIQTELFRTKTGWADIYLVTTLDSGTTTYSDDVDDTTLQAATAFDEDGFYPPPDNIDYIIYHPGADRLFFIVVNEVYWTEAGLYHVVFYDKDLGDYENVNAVYLDGEPITAALLMDEQLYFGSKKTWTRLRGKNPTYWSWEPTSAIAGPLSFKSCIFTNYGAVYPCIDGYFYLFQGIDSKTISDHFEFAVKPDGSSFGTFNGRFMYFYYVDPDYPELVIDFRGFPQQPIKIVKSTRDYSAVHYSRMTAKLYAGDSNGYIRCGQDMDTEITMSFVTGEIPVERLINLGDAGSMLVDADTKGDNLVITPVMDDVDQNSLTPIVLASRKRKPISIGLGTYRAISFSASITSKKDIKIQEPWFLRKEVDN